MSNYVGGYLDEAGIFNRANAALNEIDRIVNDRSVPPATRLVWVAERMAQEPIMTDPSPAAHRVRRLAAERDRFPPCR